MSVLWCLLESGGPWSLLLMRAVLRGTLPLPANTQGSQDAAWILWPWQCAVQRLLMFSGDLNVDNPASCRTLPEVCSLCFFQSLYNSEPGLIFSAWQMQPTHGVTRFVQTHRLKCNGLKSGQSDCLLVTIYICYLENLDVNLNDSQIWKFLWPGLSWPGWLCLSMLVP